MLTSEHVDTSIWLLSSMGSEVFELQELDCKMQDRFSQWCWQILPSSEMFQPVYTASYPIRQKVYRVNIIECDVIGTYAYTSLLMVYSDSDQWLLCLLIWQIYMINVANYARKVTSCLWVCCVFTLYFWASIKKSMLNLAGGMCLQTRCSSKCSLHCEGDPRF